MNEELIYAGVALVPLIVGLVQAGKRFAPNASDNVWFGASLFLGVVGSSASYVASEGVPGNISEALALVILGLSWGLSASKAYDEAKQRRNSG